MTITTMAPGQVAAFDQALAEYRDACCTSVNLSSEILDNISSFWQGIAMTTTRNTETARAMNAATSLVIAIIEEETRSLSEDDSLAISRDYLATLSGLPLRSATKIAEQLVAQGAIERVQLPNGGNRAYYTRKSPAA